MKFDNYIYDDEWSIGFRVPYVCTDHHAALFTTKGPEVTGKLFKHFKQKYGQLIYKLL